MLSPRFAFALSLILVIAAAWGFSLRNPRPAHAENAPEQELARLQSARYSEWTPSEQ